ncbi:MAG TPA: exodeoxyribonuclease III [Gammaproteobacteria bacterium]|nr:exodeoxyribonuclease III [Gammaproteobacteria bacterium]
MRVITANLNGIRSAARKGFFDWLTHQNADLVCVQELKAQENDMNDPVLRPDGYHSYFHFAEKKGYSGVGIYTRIKPKDVVTGLGWSEADQEGRYVALNLGDVWIASLYLPSGTSGDDRQAVKYDFLNKYAEQLNEIRNSKKEWIICGDWNIAHKQIDLKNWRSNQKNSGFLPDERAWMDKLFGEMEFVDAFRVVNQESEQYTWWSNRGQAWAKNVGWRIDYQVVTPGLKSAIKSASIYKDERFSDHAPLLMDYAIPVHK